MTAIQLIRLLRNFPPDSPVLLFAYGEHLEIESCTADGTDDPNGPHPCIAAKDGE